jgi:hypothetical protein
MILGAVHRSPGICLTAEEIPRKPQLGDRHCLKWGPFPPNEVGRIAQHVRMGEGWKLPRDGYCHSWVAITMTYGG